MNRTLQTPPTAPLIIIIQPQGEKQEKALQRTCTAALWVKRKEPTKSKATRGGRSLYMSFNFLFIKETENWKQMCAVWPRPPCDTISFWCLFFCIRIMVNSSFVWRFNRTQKRNGDRSQAGRSWIQENRRLKLDTGPETWTDWKKTPQNKARKKGYCESSAKLELIKPDSNPRIKAQGSRLDLLATSVSLGHYLQVQF